MADLATPSAATMSTIDAGSEPKLDKTAKARPEKPDEQQYKEGLARAEKEYTLAQEKLVRNITVLPTGVALIMLTDLICFCFHFIMKWQLDSSLLETTRILTSCKSRMRSRQKSTLHNLLLKSHLPARDSKS